MRTIEDLLPDLVAKTVVGNISWRKRSAPSAGYETVLAKYKVVVWEWNEVDSENEGVTVSIYTKDNDQLDYISVDQYSSRYAKFLEAYQTARRSALGLDKIIDEIAAALDEVMPF